MAEFRETGYDDAADPNLDLLTELYDLETANWRATANRIQACCNELGRLDDFATFGDPLERQLHVPLMPDARQSRAVLLRRWPYASSRFISEIVVTDSYSKRDSEEISVDNAVFRIDRRPGALAITGDYHHGFAYGRELVLPERAGPTIWQRADGGVGLEYGVVDSQPVPRGIMGNLDSFIAGRIAAKRLLKSIFKLGSDTLVTDFQFVNE